MVAQIEISAKLYRSCALFVILVRCQRIQISKQGYQSSSKFPSLSVNFHEKFPQWVRKNYSGGTTSSFIGHMPHRGAGGMVVSPVDLSVCASCGFWGHLGF